MRNFATELHQQRKTSKHSSRRGTDGEHGAAVAHGRDPRMASLGETLEQEEIDFTVNNVAQLRQAITTKILVRKGFPKNTSQKIPHLICKIKF